MEFNEFFSPQLWPAAGPHQHQLNVYIFIKNHCKLLPGHRNRELLTLSVPGKVGTCPRDEFSSLCPCCAWSCKPQGQRMKAAGMRSPFPGRTPLVQAQRQILCALTLFPWQFSWEHHCKWEHPQGMEQDGLQGWTQVVLLVDLCMENVQFFYFSPTSKLLLFPCAVGFTALCSPQLVSPLCPTWAWRGCFSH